MTNFDKNFIYLITGQHIGTGTLYTINNKTDEHLYTSYTHHCCPDKEREIIKVALVSQAQRKFSTKAYRNEVPGF